VAFPDDDCWYEKDLLEKVVVLFTEHPDIDVISGRTVRPDGQNSLGKFDKHSGLSTAVMFLKEAIPIPISSGEKW
jgi:hypothetical protein